MKISRTEKLFTLCKEKMLSVLRAVQAGHPVDEETTHALVELWAEFLLVSNKQGEPMQFCIADVALVTIQAAVALRKVCKRLGHDKVPQDVEAVFWKVLGPVLVPPGSN